VTRENESARDRLVRHVATQAGWCEGISPLYAALLGRLATDVEAGGVGWQLLGPHSTDRLGSALALRVMAAVHRIVLEGRAPELAAFYPSVGGSAPVEEAWGPFRDVLATHAIELAVGLKRGLQTNEVGRCQALVGGFLTVAHEFGLPLRTLEIGASAGLIMRWDHYLYEARGAKWGDEDSPVKLCSFNTPPAPPLEIPATVAERRGCDPSPIDAASEGGRLSLLSFVWPDQAHRIRMLRSALDVAQKVPVQIDAEGAENWLASQLTSPVEDVATVVHHSIVMQYLEHDERDRVMGLIEEAGAGATDSAPLAWLRFEPGEEGAETRLTMWPGGEERLIATSDYHGGNVVWLG
jgi:hypothetical protein